MKNILIVTTHTDIENRLMKMVAAGELPLANYSIVVEFFDSKPYVPMHFRNIFMIDDLRNRAAIEEAKLKCKDWGPFDQVVSTDEYAVFLAAEIRAFLGMPGMQTAEAVKFRDKVEMKRALVGSAVKFPKLYEVDELLNDDLLFPVIAKPRSFAGSKGVQIIRNQKDLLNLREQLVAKALLNEGFHEFDLNDLEFEQFIEGSVFHIDGLVMNGEIIFSHASQYQGNCLAFIKGAPLGSISVSDETENQKWLDFSALTCKVLNVPNGAFHLEAFINPKGERVFLEIGIRPGGSLVVPAIKSATGIDLDVAHLQCQLGITPQIPNLSKIQYGWLIFAKEYESSGSDSKVTKIKVPSLEDLKTLKWYALPAVGERVASGFSYMNNLGAFLFNSTKSENIRSDMNVLLKNFVAERS